MTNARNAPVPGLSDLSVTEFLTLARMGFRPHGLVVGVSFYDAGAASSQYTLGFTDAGVAARELDGIATAVTMHKARALAVQRMRAQASALRAEGVVGVKLSFEHHRWHGAHMVSRFLAVGTAIGFDPDLAPTEMRDAPTLRLHDGGPFTSDLSGHDFITLLRAGYRPVTVAMGNAVYAIDPRLSVGYKLSFKNEEVVTYTQGFFDARETAMDALANDLFGEFPQGHPDAPSGIVGMTVNEEIHGMLSSVIEFTAIGTAIAPLREGDPRQSGSAVSPTIVVPLDR